MERAAQKKIMLGLIALFLLGGVIGAIIVATRVAHRVHAHDH